MILFQQLTKRFGRFTVVEDLSLEVAAREAVALWGPNGAGKTTVIRCLLGLLRYQGQITVDGLCARRQGRAVRHLLGYVPQELAFYEDLGTLETALFFGRLKGVPRQRAAEVLEYVGLAEHATKRVGALSGGMKQRLALAVALLADPPILVLDEPTASLDAEAREQFLELLRHARADGKTVLVTSHRLAEVEALADRVAVMDRGHLVLSCPAAELAQRLGLTGQLVLRLPAEVAEQALAVLAAGGFAARRNGEGLVVEVPAGAKARPIQLLGQAGIPVHDFEVG